MSKPPSYVWRAGGAARFRAEDPEGYAAWRAAETKKTVAYYHRLREESPERFAEVQRRKRERVKSRRAEDPAYAAHLRGLGRATYHRHKDKTNASRRVENLPPEKLEKERERNAAKARRKYHRLTPEQRAERNAYIKAWKRNNPDYQRRELARKKKWWESLAPEERAKVIARNRTRRARRAAKKKGTAAHE